MFLQKKKIFSKTLNMGNQSSKPSFCLNSTCESKGSLDDLVKNLMCTALLSSRPPFLVGVTQTSSDVSVSW